MNDDVSCELITISGPQLIDFLLGNCSGLFRTTPRSRVGPEILGNVLKRRRQESHDRSFPNKISTIQYYPRVNHYKVWRIMHRRRLGKIHQRTKYQQARPGILLTKHESPIVCLRMYRGILYASSLNGQIRFYQTQTLTEHPRHRNILTPNGGAQTLQIAHCKRFGSTVLCVAGFDQTVRLYRDHPSHESRGEITLAAPVHCTAVKFHILMVGLGSGEVAFISLKKVSFVFYGNQSSYQCNRCVSYIQSNVRLTSSQPLPRHVILTVVTC